MVIFDGERICVQLNRMNWKDIVEIAAQSQYSEYFSDVSDMLHKELCDNIYSLHFEKEMQNICGKSRDVITYNNTNISN